MLNLKIDDMKDFVKKLLTDNTFDSFLLTNAFVISDVTYSIDGRLNRDFFDTDEEGSLTSQVYTTWEHARPHIYNVIRGKKLPLKFKLVFILSETNTMNMLEKYHVDIPMADIANLALNIYYDGTDIHVTSIATRNSFTMDKTLERVWDESLTAFFKYHGILLSDV